MSTHHYPISSLYADYGRVGLGLALTLGPVLLLDLASFVLWLLSGLAVLFGWFGVRTGLRQLSAVELSPEALVVRGPLGGRMPWEQLSRLKLAYYAPRSRSASRRRDRHEEQNERAENPKGWLQLTLQGAQGRPIRIESTLDGFEQVLQQSLATAHRKDLSLDPTTMANLAALGLEHTGNAPGFRPLTSDPNPVVAHHRPGSA